MKGLARGAIVAAIGVLALAPLLVLVLESVADQWFYPAILPVGYTLGGWRLAFSGALAAATVTSLAVAVATALLGTMLAVPIGRALARLTGWRRHAAAAAVFLPVAAPPLALGTGLQVGLLAIGAGGTTAGVLAAHLVPAVGYLSLYFLGVFTLRDPRPELEARTLGATPWQTWALVTLPTLRRPIADALGLGFLVSWTQFALTLVVGGGSVRALPLEVYAFVRAGQDRPAAVGALLLVLPALAMLASLRWVAGHELATPS